jgi:hypothetical protein
MDQCAVVSHQSVGLLSAPAHLLGDFFQSCHPRVAVRLHAFATVIPTAVVPHPVGPRRPPATTMLLTCAHAVGLSHLPRAPLLACAANAPDVGGKPPLPSEGYLKQPLQVGTPSLQCQHAVRRMP